MLHSYYNYILNVTVHLFNRSFFLMSLLVSKHYRTSHMSSSLLLQQWTTCHLSSYLDGLRWAIKGCITVTLRGAVPGFVQNSTQHPSSRLDFSSSVSLNSLWCSHTIVLKRLQLGRNSCFILSEIVFRFGL